MDTEPTVEQVKQAVEFHLLMVEAFPWLKDVRAVAVETLE